MNLSKIQVMTWEKWVTKKVKLTRRVLGYTKVTTTCPKAKILSNFSQMVWWRSKLWSSLLGESWICKFLPWIFIICTDNVKTKNVNFGQTRQMAVEKSNLRRAQKSSALRNLDFVKFNAHRDRIIVCWVPPVKHFWHFIMFTSYNWKHRSSMNIKNA